MGKRGRNKTHFVQCTSEHQLIRKPKRKRWKMTLHRWHNTSATDAAAVAGVAGVAHCLQVHALGSLWHHDPIAILISAAHPKWSEKQQKLSNKWNKLSTNCAFSMFVFLFDDSNIYHLFICCPVVVCTLYTFLCFLFVWCFFSVPWEFFVHTSILPMAGENTLWYRYGKQVRT